MSSLGSVEEWVLRQAQEREIGGELSSHTAPVTPILCAMISHAPDPYARQRSLWSRHGAIMPAGWSGGLRSLRFSACFNKPGLWSRWLAREMGRLEHGLRCLLIVGAQKVRCVTPPQPSPSRGGRFDPDCGDDSVHAKDNSLPLVGRVGVGGFSFSLKAFDNPKNTNSTISKRPQKAPRPADAPNDIDLTTRLDAVLDVFENSAAYTAEMANRLVKRGIKLKRLLAQRPSGVERPFWTDALAPAPFLKLPKLDSS